MQNTKKSKQTAVADSVQKEKAVFHLHHINNKSMVTSLYGGANEWSDIRLVLKKRRSAVRYSFPVEWTDDANWMAMVDFNDYIFSKGTWDYYVQGASEKLQRIGAADEVSLEGLPPLYCPSDKGSKVIRHYVTENGNVSFVSDKVDVHISGIETDTQDTRHVSIAARADGLPIWHHNAENDVKMSIRERNSHDESIIPCQLELKDGKHYLSFEVDYEALAQTDLSANRRWDILLHLSIEGVYVAFQTALTTNQIKDVSRVQFDDEALHQMFFYQTEENHLALSYTDVPLVRNVETYKLSRNVLFLKGYAYLDAASLSEEEHITRSVIVKTRSDGAERVIPLKNTSAAQHDFQVKIPLKDIYSEEPYDEIYDFYIELSYKHITRRRKLGRNPYTFYKDEILAEAEQMKSFRKRYVRYYLTYTPKGNLKLETFALNHSVKKYLEKGQYKDDMQEDVWLIGERPDTAQDTGYHFFKYCREHYPDKNIYYVIDEGSKDVANVRDLANVLYRGSLEHFKKAAVAGVLIGSHDLEYILPIKGVALRSYKKAKKVFLQHGVLGRKSAEYHRHYYKYPFDLFCVSSTSEKKLVNRKMDYDLDEIKVTGLSRFDTLLEPHTEKRSILVIPTWREWLNDEETFCESDYFNRYKSLLESDRLQDMLAKHDVQLTLYPHYRMQPFIDQFAFDDIDHVDVIAQGEKNVQELLLESKLMITDYSSVSFDFNYMSKPVIFYHFDQDSFFRNGKLRPIEETFLGDICTDKETVLDKTEMYLQTHFAEKEEVARDKYLVFDHVDLKNCARIYESIQVLLGE